MAIKLETLVNSALDVYATATAQEAERWTRAVKAKICFDHQANASCQHQACYVLDELLAVMHGEQTK